jgi:paraquat-inducible protein B
MSKGTSKTMIGGFVVGAVALLIVAVVIFGSGKLFSKQLRLVLFFQESVSGLNVGAPVVFRGVTIGSVVGVELWTYPQKLKMVVPVYIDFDPARFKDKGQEENILSKIKAGTNLKSQIEKGLRAQLKMQSLVTGQMMVYVDYFPDKPIRLLGAEPRYPELPTISSGTEEIMKTLEKIPVQEIIANATKTLAGIEQLVNSPEIKEAISNLNGGLKEVRKVAQNVDSRIEPLFTEVQGILADARRILKNVDGQISPLAGDLKTTLKEVEGTLAEARRTLKSASETVSDESVLSVEIINSLDEMNRAIRSINALAEYLKRNPDALLWGKKSGGGK